MEHKILLKNTIVEKQNNIYMQYCKYSNENYFYYNFFQSRKHNNPTLKFIINISNIYYLSAM